MKNFAVPSFCTFRLVHLASISTLSFFLLWASGPCLDAQDLTPSSTAWIPPASDTSGAPDPTPIPDTTTGPNATPPPGANGGGLLAVPDINWRGVGVVPPVPEDPALISPIIPSLPTDNAVIPDPPVDPETAPNDNTPYDRGETTFQPSAADSPSASQSATPAPDEITPATNTDVSTTINTGCGYDAWSGSTRRAVRDLSVTGSIGGHGLNFVRTYSSHRGPLNDNWTHSYAWKLFGRPYGGLVAVMPDGREVQFRLPQIPGEKAYRALLGTKERLILHDDSNTSGTADLYLEDGSVVHFTRETEYNDSEWVDTFIAQSETDPHGQQTTLTYEQIPGTFEPWYIRLIKVTDHSNRSLTLSYDDPTRPTVLKQVMGSDGQYAQYPDGVATGMRVVNYSDGTQAHYDYGWATNHDPVTGNDGSTYELTVAQDTRAEGAMRSIQYDYKPYAKSNWAGEVAAERHYPSGALVSSFLSNDDRSGLFQPTETRGDGPSRTFAIQKVDKTPLMQWKEDFKGIKEFF
jgi:hypothetical protein